MTDLAKSLHYGKILFMWASEVLLARSYKPIHSIHFLASQECSTTLLTIGPYSRANGKMEGRSYRRSRVEELVDKGISPQHKICIFVIEAMVKADNLVGNKEDSYIVCALIMVLPSRGVVI
ncbi:unnamed protein product [Ilex paraguariensis]|uniref:Uncharacterized protein n=1 Tax=Ilex paraguariensis TaxID=185542 RepID=A0ABC8TRA3_9AQUA